jgi:hypothetical protein
MFKFKGENVLVAKKLKKRLTVLICANMSGTDKEIVIGRSQKPRCFKNVRKLPVEYVANKKHG